MRLKTIMLYVCLVTSHLFSQTGNLLGTVSDSNGSFPLPGANVYLEGTNLEELLIPEERFIFQIYQQEIIS